MPDPPLPAETVGRLKSDRAFALAAAVVIASTFPDICRWALSVLCPARGDLNGAERLSPSKPARMNGNGAVHGKINGARSPVGAHERDQALLETMRANPGATLAQLIELSGRPRTSTVTSLRRLEEAGAVEHRSKGQYVVADPDFVEPPSARVEGPPWVAPLSGRHRARHSAEGRVREPGEMQMA